MIEKEVIKIILRVFSISVFVIPVFAQISCPVQTNFSSDYAILVGEIRDTGGDPNISAWFEWGNSYFLNNRTPVQNLYISYTPFRFCDLISNLQPCTTYYYRAVASNNGGTNFGQIFSFQTPCYFNQTTTSINSISNQLPIAIIKYSPQEIKPGTKVTFNALSSYDPDGYIISYTWKVNGKVESSSSIFERVLSSGTYEIELLVKDNSGDINNQKLIISVGRNIFTTKTVYQPKPVYIPIENNETNNLVDLVLEDFYQVQKCTSSDINFALINNTSVKRKVILEITGEIKTWFEPQQREFVLNPREKLKINWKLNSPCKTEKDNYLFTLKLSTPNFNKDYNGIIEIQSQKSTNPLSAFISLIFNNFSWLLVFVLLFIIGFLVFNNYIRHKVSI